MLLEAIVEFLEAVHPEWCSMWEELGNHALNSGDPICLSSGECWEYMGSTDDHHHFRHLHHPSTGEKAFVYIERRRAALAWAG